jgi:hypothetical protein
VAKFDDEEVTLSTLNTRTGVKSKTKAKTTSHSSYWLDTDDWEEVEDPNTIDKAIRLAAVRRAVANFVRILTNDSTINVKFNDGRTSYTDGKTVVIAAQDKPKDFDVMVGLALHEASHCLLTDIRFYGAFTHPDVMIGNGHSIGFWHNGNLRDGIADFFHPDFRNTIVVGSETQMRDLLGKLMLMLNLVEDRRIDQYVYNTAVGYRPYYGALYKKYFLSTAIDKGLKEDVEWKDPSDVDSYVNRLINIMNPHSNANALPGLDKMFTTFDVENIHRLTDYTPNVQMAKFITEMGNQYEGVINKSSHHWHRQNLPQADESYIHSVFLDDSQRKLKNYNTMPPTWILANELLAQVVKASGYIFESQQPPQQTPQPSGEGEGQPMDGEGEGEGEPQEGDVDGNGASGNTSVIPDGKKVAAPPSASRLKKALANQRKFINGDLRKTRIASKLNEMVKSVEEASAEIVEVGSKTSALGKIRTPCIVINNVTKQLMMEDWFIFGPSVNGYYNGVTQVRNQNEPFVKAGIRMGQVLAQRLAIRNDPTITHYTRQNSGKIDRRILSQLGMDITNVFKRTRTDKYNPVTLYLSLDASGSMSGKKWGKALTVATALSYLADKVPDVNVVVMARGGSDTATVAVLHDSRKQKFVVARQIFELTTACGATPESLCYEATLNFIVDKEKKTDVFFINFSDGEPSFSLKNVAKDDSSDGGYYSYYAGFSGTTAVEHCRQTMNLYREAGVKIMSYFITDSYYDAGGSKDAFKRMYGENAEFVNVENVTQVLKTLQKLLSDKGGMESIYS